MIIYSKTQNIAQRLLISNEMYFAFSRNHWMQQTEVNSLLPSFMSQFIMRTLANALRRLIRINKFDWAVSAFLRMSSITVKSAAVLTQFLIVICHRLSVPSKHSSIQSLFCFAFISSYCKLEYISLIYLLSFSVSSIEVIYQVRSNVQISYSRVS